MVSVARRVILPAFLLLAVLLAACGGSGGGGAPVAARTITDAGGSTVTVPGRPERVLPLSEPTLDATLALGLTPIATTAGRGQNAIPAYLVGRTKGVKNVGALGAPDLEKVAALAPEVILIDGTAFQDPAVIDKLRKIAPTVYISKTGENWRTAFTKAAKALGREDAGDEVLADYDAKVAKVKAAIAPHASDTVSIVRWGGIGLPAVIMKELAAGRVLTDLGLARPSFQNQDGPGHSVPVSLEQLERIDGDWIFFGALGAGGPDGGAVDLKADVTAAQDAIEMAKETPGFTRLKGYRDGHVVPVDGSAWTSAGGPLAVNVVLDAIDAAMGGA